MKKSTFIILAVLAIALALIYFIAAPTKREEITFEVPDIQISLDPEKIVKVEIDRADMYIRLERIRGVWKLLEPVSAVADDESVQELLQGISQFRIAGLVSSNPERYGIYQLDESGSTIIFTTDDTKRLVLIVGKSSPNPRLTYVRPEASTSVYVAEGISPKLIDKELREWRQRTIYRTHPDSLKMVTLKNQSDRFIIRRRAARWVADDKTVPARLMNPLLNAVSYVRASDFVDTALIVSGAPALQVEILESELVRMEFYPTPARKDYFLKVSPSAAIYVVKGDLVHVFNQVVDHLAVPPAVAVAPTPTPAAAPPQPTAPATTGGGRIEDDGELTIHTVRRGEDLQSIARQYGVSVDQLRRWNALTRDVVSPGMELYVFVRRR